MSLGQTGLTAERKESVGTAPGRAGPLPPRAVRIPVRQKPLSSSPRWSATQHTYTVLWAPGPPRRGSWQKDSSVAGARPQGRERPDL